MTAQNPAIFLQAGSHPSEDLRRFIYGTMGGRSGIVTAADLAVTQNGTPNMSVNVAGGQAFISGTEGTYQGLYFVENRGVTNLTIAAADATNARKDLIVAKVQDAGYSGATNLWSLAVVTGTPSASPAEPAAPANSFVVAMVTVAALATSITNANITDRRSRAASLGGIVPCLSTTRPTGVDGLEIWETDTKRLLVHDGTNWVVVRTPITTYTPTLGNVTGGTPTGTYQVWDKVVHLSVNMVAGTVTANGSITISLPAGLTSAASPSLQVALGQIGATPALASARIANSSSSISCFADAAGNNWAASAALASFRLQATILLA